jgi:hypothetical protein
LEQIDELFTGEKVLIHWKGSMNETEMPQDLPTKFSEKTEAKHVDDGKVAEDSP